MITPCSEMNYRRLLASSTKMAWCVWMGDVRSQEVSYPAPRMNNTGHQHPFRAECELINTHTHTFGAINTEKFYAGVFYQFRNSENERGMVGTVHLALRTPYWVGCFLTQA